MQEITKRCQSCGTPLETNLPHLRNCEFNKSTTFKTNSNFVASRAQIDLVCQLSQQLGYDTENYKLQSITMSECSKLIESLLLEVK